MSSTTPMKKAGPPRRQSTMQTSTHSTLYGDSFHDNSSRSSYSLEDVETGVAATSAFVANAATNYNAKQEEVAQQQKKRRIHYAIFGIVAVLLIVGLIAGISSKRNANDTSAAAAAADSPSIDTTTQDTSIIIDDVEYAVDESSPSADVLELWSSEDVSSSSDVSTDAIVDDEDEELEEDTSPSSDKQEGLTLEYESLLNNEGRTTTSSDETSIVTSSPTAPPTKSPVITSTTSPSSSPSKSPTNEPTQPPQPSIDLSGWNVMEPTPPPTNKPVFDMSSWGDALKVTPPPSASPTTTSPSQSPTTHSPTSAPTQGPTTNPYFFGTEFITVPELEIEMSTGLNVRLIARTGEKVQYANGDESDRSWHTNSDAAGIIPLEDGGYVYMSNSEADDGKGGVYGLYFNAEGEIVEYKALLTGTTDNCGGGLTPWGTWVSCEEESDVGQCWQVGPDGRAEETVLGEEGGNYESVAVDHRVYDRPVFFTTEDSSDGALRRFIASQHGWDALHTEGEHSYLHLLDDGTFEWTTSLSTGRDSAEKYFPNAEGIQVHEGNVYFMSKEKQIMIILNQEDMTWTSEKTGKKFYGEGSFGGQPDQHVFGPTRKYIYFTEDGSSDPGVYARYDDGTYFTMFQAISGGLHTDDETIGIALSPDGKRFYAGFQEGYIFEFTRKDNLAFE